MPYPIRLNAIITVQKYEPVDYEQRETGPILTRIHVEENFDGDIQAVGVAESVDPTLAETPEPYVPVTLSPDDGPVLLSVEYRIPLDSQPDFLEAARHLARMRRREGALHWGLYTDPNASSNLHGAVLERAPPHRRPPHHHRCSRPRQFHHGKEPKLTAMLAIRDLGPKHRSSAGS